MDRTRQQILDVPDIRQRDRFSCGAAASMASGRYRGVGPDSLDEWKANLGTNVEKSTAPRAIVDYLRSLGLEVEAHDGMTVDDLARYAAQGWPVICPVQDYKNIRDPKAAFAYGHYLTVCGVAGEGSNRYIVAQDSSIENEELKSGGDTPKGKEQQDQNIEAPGKILVREADWLANWHDQDEAGNKLIRFGIAVGPKEGEAARSFQVRTVWVAGGQTIPPAVATEPPGAMAGPFQRKHIARVFDSRETEKVIGGVGVEDGVQEYRVVKKGDAEPTVAAYEFDADKFTIPQAMAWLSNHQVNNYTNFEPAAGTLPSQSNSTLSQFHRSEGQNMDPETGMMQDGMKPHGMMNTMRPYQGIHAARVMEPSDYKEIVGQKEIAPGVNALFAKKDGKEGTEIASYHFDAGKFTPEKAKKWLAHAKVDRYQFEPAAEKKREDKEPDEDEASRAVWSTAEKNDLPDSAFLYVESGEKDSEGKTTPRDKRHFPYKNKAGEIDLPHLRDALSRIPQAKIPENLKKELTAKAERLLDSHKPKEPSGRSLPLSDENDRVRSIPLQPNTWDETTGSCLATVASDDPVFSTEVRSGKKVHEVWRMDGMEHDDQVPLLDSHKAGSVHNVLGSLRSFSTGDHEASARLHISEAEPKIRTKVREGHITDVSGRASPLESTMIPAGRSATVRGATYTARKDQPLTVHTRWRLREVSLTPMGADPKAKIRSASKETKMNDKVRKFLETLGLERTATADQAQEFYNSLPEKTRAVADAETTRAAPPSVDADKIRAEGAAAERKRSADITDAVVKAFGKNEQGAPREPDLIRRALDDNWTIEKLQESIEFLQQFRDRTKAVAPSGHSRGADDLTVEVLTAAQTIRCLEMIPSDKPGASFRNNPLSLLNRYRPQPFVRAGIGSYRASGRSITDDIDGQTRKLNEKLFNQAERFRNMAIPDVAAQCLRMADHSFGYMSAAQVIGAIHDDTIREGPSGGAFSAIYTAVFNATFLSGYLEAQDTTLGWVAEGDSPDFKKGEVGMPGKMGFLTKSGTAPAEHMSGGDWNEQIQVDRYTGQYEVSEMDLINDRFNVQENWAPQELGLSARRVRPNLVYAILLGKYTAGTGRGPTLNQDNVQLFHATHNNFTVAANNGLYTHSGSPSSGSVDTTVLDDAIPLIKNQRLNNVPLNLTPRFALMSPSLLSAMRRALFSTQRIISAGSGGTLNPLQAFNIETRDDSRLDVAGCVDPNNVNKTIAGLKYHFFLVCRPGEEGAKTMLVKYLAGTGRAPQIRSYILGGPGRPGEWGIGWDVKHDIGACALDFRAMFYAESST